MCLVQLFIRTSPERRPIIERLLIIKGQSSWGDHYVVAYFYSESTIKVMDPWGGKFGDLGSTTLTSWSDYYICTKKVTVFQDGPPRQTEAMPHYGIASVTIVKVL